jgi:hypothetical protein
MHEPLRSSQLLAWPGPLANVVVAREADKPDKISRAEPARFAALQRPDNLIVGANA